MLYHLQSPTSSSFQEARQRIVIASSSPASWKLNVVPPSIACQFELPGSFAPHLHHPSSPASWKLNVVQHSIARQPKLPGSFAARIVVACVASFLEAGCRTTFNCLPVRASRKLRSAYRRRIVASFQEAGCCITFDRLPVRASRKLRSAYRRPIVASFLEAGCRTTFNRLPAQASRKLGSDYSSPSSFKYACICPSRSPSSARSVAISALTA